MLPRYFSKGGRKTSSLTAGGQAFRRCLPQPTARSPGLDDFLPQEGTAGNESLTSVAVGEDSSAVMGRYSSEDFVMVQLDAHGNKLWNWTVRSALS